MSTLEPTFGRSWLLLCLFLLLPDWSQAEPRWKIQYSYDKNYTMLELRDLQCPSAQRCIAAGVTADRKDHESGIVVLTSDGGKQWTTLEVRERPISLFFLNDSLGWMVTEKGVWSTEESGRSWKKLEGLKGILRVYFLNPSHGYAIGFPKAVYETTDGGKKWTKLAAAAQPNTEPKETSYNCITFRGDYGVIIGTVGQQQSDEEPIWLDQRRARYRREREKTAVVLETTDGGKTWNAEKSIILGDPLQLRLHPDGFAALLVAFHDFYSVPSTVFKLAFGKRGPTTVLSEKDRAVTDFSFLPDGSGLVASIEPPGNSNQVPVPAKLHVLTSSNLKLWTEMEVDYRAVAQRAVLAVVDAQHAWMATDTGMILSLVDSAGTKR